MSLDNLLSKADEDIKVLDDKRRKLELDISRLETEKSLLNSKLKESKDSAIDRREAI